MNRLGLSKEEYQRLTNKVDGKDSSRSRVSRRKANLPKSLSSMNTPKKLSPRLKRQGTTQENLSIEDLILIHDDQIERLVKLEIKADNLNGKVLQIIES